MAGALVERVLAAGAACKLVALEDLPAALPAEHVVCLWHGPVRARCGGGGAAAVERGAFDGAVAGPAEQAPRLWWVTRGAVAVTAGEAAEVAQASLWGLGRTVMQEHPELTAR